MKVLQLNQIENIEGGTVSNFITGACVAAFIGTQVGWLALTTPQGWVLGGVCAINGGGSIVGWW